MNKRCPPECITVRHQPSWPYCSCVVAAERSATEDKLEAIPALAVEVHNELRAKHEERAEARAQAEFDANQLVDGLVEAKVRTFKRSPLRVDHEICIVAAIRLPDGRIFRGQRHSDCIRTACDLIEYRHRAGYEPSGWTSEMSNDQGFITSRGRYVGREEGRRLQEAAGIASVAEGGYRGDLLFSEDLY